MYLSERIGRLKRSFRKTGHSMMIDRTPLIMKVFLWIKRTIQ